MPRPQRCRRICFEPEVCRFGPEGGAEGRAVVLSLDEFEVIRLGDAEYNRHMTEKEGDGHVQTPAMPENLL